MPFSIRLSLLAAALLAGAPAGAQVPQALHGTWADADSSLHVYPLDDGQTVEQTTLYQEAILSDSAMVWTTVWRSHGEINGWRESVGLRAEGDRLLAADGMVGRYRLAGDTLTVSFEPPDGGDAQTTTLLRSDPTPSSRVVGLWSGGWVDDGAGIMVAVGLRFLDDGTVQTIPENPEMQYYHVAGPYLLLSRHPPIASGGGGMTLYNPLPSVARLTVAGDRLVLSASPSSEAVTLRRVE